MCNALPGWLCDYNIWLVVGKRVMNKSQLWDLLSEICGGEGVTLFEIEPSGIPTAGVLKVFIHLAGEKGVQHTHCAAVSTRILNHARVEDLLPGSMTLEVSSPGINRKLTRTEHFEGAVGERVKVSYLSSADQKKTTIIGRLAAFDGSQVEITPELKSTEIPQTLTVPLQSVKEARVDFLFD